MPLEKMTKIYGAAATKNLEAKGDLFFNLFAKGLKPGNRYTLYMVNTLLNKTMMGDFVVNRNGELESVKDRILLSNHNLMVVGPIKGEQMYYVLVSSNKKTYLAVQIIPDPIEYQWSDQAYVNALLLTKDATQFMVVGKGFQPNEQLVVTSQSGDEIGHFNVETNKDGMWISIILPGTIGKKGGPASVSVKRSHSAELGTMNYLWGTAVKNQNCSSDLFL